MTRNRVRKILETGIVAGALAALAIAGTTYAADVKSAGSLKLPPNTDLIVICNDPLVNSVLNDDLSAERRTLGSVTSTITLTVEVNQKVMAPGVSMTDLFPGDPSMAKLLAETGVEAPPLGDTGSQAADPYAEAARRQAMGLDDPLTSSFRNYQAMEGSMRNGSGSPYESIPKSQIYDTIISARAEISSGTGEFKVVAVVHGGDSINKGKKLVAEEIANAILR
jgi:hypothetical protein